MRSTGRSSKARSGIVRQPARFFRLWSPSEQVASCCGRRLAPSSDLEYRPDPRRGPLFPARREYQSEPPQTVGAGLKAWRAGPARWSGARAGAGAIQRHVAPACSRNDRALNRVVGLVNDSLQSRISAPASMSDCGTSDFGSRRMPTMPLPGRGGARRPPCGRLCGAGPRCALLRWNRDPWRDRSIRGIALVGRRGLARLLTEPGELTASDGAGVADFLARRFPAA